LLCPVFDFLVTENIKIMVDERLIKIDNHKIEYFLLNFFISLQPEIIDRCSDHFLASKGVQAGVIRDAVREYPVTFLPEFRKKRTYISANLSKHEINSSNPYNKKLFKRHYRGYYSLNPDLAIWVNDEWKNVYELMQSVEVKVPTQEEKEQWLEEYRKHLREQEYWDDDEFDENPWYEDSDEYIDEDIDVDEIDKMIDEQERNRPAGYKFGDGDPVVKKTIESSKSPKKEVEETENTDPPKKQNTPDTQFRIPFDDI
ncbi:MAG: hypothetical protein KAT15_20530, partial [Bacteroidales bacterium]|nr:hypothetical protein [Bacteroidales bacterium]